jgi:hypothetical protein
MNEQPKKNGGDFEVTEILKILKSRAEICKEQITSADKYLAREDCTGSTKSLYEADKLYAQDRLAVLEQLIEAALYADYPTY